MYCHAGASIRPLRVPRSRGARITAKSRHRAAKLEFERARLHPRDESVAREHRGVLAVDGLDHVAWGQISDYALLFKAIDTDCSRVLTMEVVITALYPRDARQATRAAVVLTDE